MEKKRRGIVVFRTETGAEVEFVEVRAGRGLDKVERGMLINMNREDYHTGQVGDDEERT